MTELNKAMRAMTLPRHIAGLKVSPTGYPVPWFVCWLKDGKQCAAGEGTPDFRVADQDKMAVAVRQNRCWICGDYLGQHKASVIGPMCAINRTISEPPSHRDCAIFSAIACPFLSKPNMRRNTNDIPADAVEPAGNGIKRNPGAVCVWVAKKITPFNVKGGHGSRPGVLFHLGDPIEVLWFAEGRTATRAEVVSSIESGLPLLMDIAKQEGPTAIAALEYQCQRVMPILPLEA